MKQKIFPRMLSVRRSPIHGYGVFADDHISAGDIIEECPTLIVNADQQGKDSPLLNYFFRLDDEQHLCVFGYGSLYNHSQKPNADYIYHPETSLMVFQALHDINKNDEIFISYGDNWFSARNIKQLELKRRISGQSFLSASRLLLRFGLVTGLLTFAIMYIR